MTGVTQKIGKKNAIYYTHVLIYFAIMVGIGLIPPFGSITELGMRVLGIFVATIYGWIFLGLLWPSIIALVGLGLVGYTSVTQAFCDGFGYLNVPILIMAFAFAAIADQTRVTEFLANWTVSRKFVVGRPYALMAVMFVGVVVLNCLGASFVGVFMIWAMVVKIAESAGAEKGKSSFVNFMIPSIIVVFVLSGFVFPFRTASVIMLGIFTKGTGLSMPDAQYIIWNFTIVAVYIAAILLVAKFILRIDVSAIKNFSVDLGATHRNDKMDGDQKFGLGLMLAYILIMLLPLVMPADWAATKTMAGLGILGALGILLAIAMARRTQEGKSYVEFSDLAAKGISWDVVWLITATTPLAAAFQDDKCGILNTLMGWLTPILTSLDPMVFIVACVIVLVIVTQFVHNLILGIVFIPILCPLCVSLGGNPYTCYLLINLALMLAFVTPAASMNAGLIFGHPWLTRKTAYAQALMHVGVGLVIAFAVGMPLANLLF